MMVAALLDLGADKNILDKALKSLSLEGFNIEISKVLKSGIDTCDFNVILDTIHENHDHDMEYLYGEKEKINFHTDTIKGHRHSHMGVDDNKHVHIKENFHYRNNEDKHIHKHRGLSEILNIIYDGDITNKAKKIASDIFTILAKAEAKAHGVDIEKVHFHEVGDIDSIVDIISVAVCLDNLNIDEVIVPVLYEGKGFVRCQHGMLPIPVPAVSNIVADNKLQLHITNTEGELITPTGAAIVASIITSNKLPERYSIKKIGLGAGKREYERPSILRAMIIEDESLDSDLIYKLESNIDDCTGEALGFVMEILLENGAKDVNYFPCYMKKNRPAYQINVICKREDIEKLENIIFQETTTIGIRRQPMERSILKRELIKVQTSLGEVQVKVCNLPLGKRFYPEYSSVVEICKRTGLSYQHVYDVIKREVNE